MFLISLASAALIIPLLINSKKVEKIDRIGGANSSIFSHQFNQKQKLSCPKNCFCAHSTVICKGLGLERVPKPIPNDTTKLDLQGNRITKLHFDDFVGLSDLRILLLGDNLIQEIDENVFEPLQALERLRLDKNRIRSLPTNGLLKSNKLLRRLDLSQNELWTISTEQIIGPTELITLNLDRNQLHCLDSLSLSQWPSLEQLTLSSNALTSLSELDLTSLPKLRTLKLGDNPWNCDCRMRWIKRLKVANQIRCYRPSYLFSRSLDKVSLKQLKCSGLEKRGVTGSKRTCRQMDGCPSVCTCTEVGGNIFNGADIVVDCHDRQLRSVPVGLPQNTVELRLEQNRITQLDANSFSHMPKLVRLDLSKNNIISVHPETFKGLKQLNSLMLFSNNLTDLGDQLFKDLDSLQVLLLNGNKIKCLRDGIFAGLKHLRLLSLYDNNIKSIAESTFSPLKNSLQILHLAKNPLICDCNLQWLAKLLLSHPIETSGARCASPTRMERRRVVTSSVEQFKCLGIESLVTVGAGKCLLDNEEACPTGCKCTSINNYFDHQQPKHLNNHRFRHRRRRLLFRHRREEIKFKHNSVIVQCSNASLVDIPWPLPQNTEELLLDNNKIGIIKIENFMGLEHLRKLDLSHNLIEHIPSNVFSPLKSLNALMLSNNRIRCLSQGAFDELGQLRILSLQSNLITKLPENVFSKFVLETQQTLSHVSLGDNPLLCDCEMNWAIKWLRSKFLEPGIARCSGPPERRQQLLLSVQPYAPCPTLNITNNVQEDLCNICSPEKCLNGGHCVVDEGNGENFPLQFKCICAPGWHGKLCEQQVDACFGHPCRNGGKCIVKIGENKLLYEGRFNCICLRGFAGERCERQINECVEKGGKERCLNGGKCLDQLNGFRCECPKGWIGNFCEFNLCGTSLIQNNNCSLIKENELIKSSFLSVSRMERANNEGKKFAKRNFCPFNYADPPKCNRRRAVAIKATNTFLSLGQWPINNFNNSIINGEISFHFATNQSDGTMFWLGDKHDDSFILLELMRGRLRAAIQLGKGHEPYSQLYSMNIVSDSKSHWLVIGIYGQKFYLTVDDFPTQFAINTGPLNFFPNEFLEIYFGGVPADLGRRALVHFKISDASSIIGCFWDLRFNQVSDIENNILPYPSLDLAKYINLNNTSIGECNN